jgi:hypothetical protein
MIVVVSHVLNWSIMLSLCFSRWLRWWHVQKDVICFVYKIIEELSTEMLDTGIFEIIFYLKLKRSHERAQVVLSPSIVMLVRRERNGDLLIKIFKNSLENIILFSDFFI